MNASPRTKGPPQNNIYTLARAPGGQMQGAATKAMPGRIVEEAATKQMPTRRRAPVGCGPPDQQQSANVVLWRALS